MTTEHFEVRNRWADRIQFTAEITCAPDASIGVKLGLAIIWAHKTGASLDGACLDGACLDGACLIRASLDGARLDGASLDGACLDGASLDGASLIRASLDKASLIRASIDGACLDGASLDEACLDGASLIRTSLAGASLDGASLIRASLDEASLDGADLPDETLRPFKADLWTTLLSLRAAPAEIAHLVQKLRDGQIDGRTYGAANNPCACLVGTIAQGREVSSDTLDRNTDRPAERWFMMIRPGDKPEHQTGGGFAARKALEWVLELSHALGINNANFTDSE